MAKHIDYSFGVICASLMRHNDAGFKLLQATLYLDQSMDQDTIATRSKRQNLTDNMRAFEASQRDYKAIIDAVDKQIMQAEQEYYASTACAAQ
jgi:virulence-associated protein VapD